MELPKYQISTNEDQTVFKFVSDGPNGKITKIVLYQPMNEPDLYNLALGDLDSKTGEIDFDIRTNNGDRDMILATITETVYAFIYSRTTYSIHFKGSDPVVVNTKRWWLMNGRNDHPDKYNSCKGQIFQNFPMEIHIFAVEDQRF
jgi:hypothetical protein